MRGNITRRGKSSWRITAYTGGRGPDGKYRMVRKAVRGTRKDAEGELTKILSEIRAGTAVAPSKTTVGGWLRDWLNGAHGLSAKTAERYLELFRLQVEPHLGAIELQKLRPADVAAWHAVLAQKGGADGQPLSTRTVQHAHRVLRRGIELALRSEIVTRNVAAVIAPPRHEGGEVAILQPGQMAALLEGLAGHVLQPIAILALSTGMRRGELLGLQWGDMDLDAGTVRIERSLEETRQGLRLKTPKTRHGRRLVSLPAMAVEALRDHWRKQIELRLQLGQGRPEPQAFVFSTIEGEPMSPDNLSRDWRRIVRSRKLPCVMFHALRHSHASALIADGMDVLTVSRRLGHGSPVVTLNTYAHQFEKTDAQAASSIEKALRKR
jgi:integrase